MEFGDPLIIELGTEMPVVREMNRNGYAGEH